jgi:hypothetical protein
MITGISCVLQRFPIGRSTLWGTPGPPWRQIRGRMPAGEGKVPKIVYHCLMISRDMKEWRLPRKNNDFPFSLHGHHGS